MVKFAILVRNVSLSITLLQRVCIPTHIEKAGRKGLDSKLNSSSIIRLTVPTFLLNIPMYSKSVMGTVYVPMLRLKGT